MKRILISVVLLAILLGSLIPAISCKETVSPTPTPTLILDNDWYESLVWMRQNTPDPFQNPDFLNDYSLCTIPAQGYSYPASAYWVMSWWDYGCGIIDIAKRLPNAIPPEKGATDAGLFFTAQDEASGSQVLDRLSSKYVIIDTSMATVKFYAMAVLAGKSQSRFSDVFYQISQMGTPQAVTFYYPEYYQSMCARLYLFGGREWVPQQVIAISWKEQQLTSANGSTFTAKVITDQKSSATYEEAKVFVDANSGYQIVSSSPLVSPVPVEKLQHFSLIHQSPTTVATQATGNISAVEIFQYSP